MMDAVDESEVASLPVGEAFRERFGNPYAVIHRADVHLSLLEGAQDTGSHRVRHRHAVSSGSSRRATACRSIDAKGNAHHGVGAHRLRRREVRGAPAARGRPGARVGPRRLSRGGRRQGLPGRPALERAGRLGRARTATWCTTRCATASNTTSSSPSTAASPRRGACTEGSPDEVLSYFKGIGDAPAPAARRCRRTGPAGRPPTASRSASGPTGAPRCSATPRIRCCSTWRKAPAWRWKTPSRWAKRCASTAATSPRRSRSTRRSRVARTARVVLSAREMGRIYHAKGVERLVRNDLWRGRAPERFYDALEWLYGWRVDNCLAA